MSYLEYTVKHVPTGLRKILHLNWPLTVLLTAVSGVGFLMLYSVAGGTFTPWAEPQMKRFALGLVLMIAVGMVPIWLWRNLAGVAYFGTVFLLVAVDLFGAVGMGAQRWIELGSFRLQPSELMKITLVMMLAAYYDWLPAKKTSRPVWVLLPLLMIIVPTFLVLKQPDLGTAILLMAAGGGLMFLAGVHWAYFAVVLTAGLGLITAVFQSRGTPWQLLKDYQFRRIDTFIHPIQDRPRVGRVDRARFHARDSVAIELPSRKAYRFHLYHLGRRVWFCRWLLIAQPICPDHLVLHCICPD